MRKYSVDGVLSMEETLISNPLEIEAQNNKEALKKYLKNRDINPEKINIKRDKNGQIQTLKFRIGKDGKKYRAGRAVWWKITKK